MTDEKRAELLMDHYKDTFGHLQAHWKVRNRLFMYMLVLVCVLALDTAKPGSLAEIGNRALNKALPAQPDARSKLPPPALVLDFSVVGSIGWFVLLCLVVQYYQRSVHVDRQYNYVDHLEKQICGLMGEDCVTREGRSYFSRKGVWEEDDGDCRPTYLRAVGLLYVYAFPALLSAFVVAKLYQDHGALPGFTYLLNLVLGLAIVTYSVLYLRWVIKRK